MKNLLILFFLTISNLNAWTTSADSYIYTVNGTDYCIYNISWNGDSFNYTYNEVNYTNGSSSQLDTYNAYDTYYYNNQCNQESQLIEPSTLDHEKLNMTLENYNLMMALTSNLLGFTLVFLVGFLFVLQGRR